MSKAILVLNEMPKSCEKCPVFNSDFYTCQLVFGELYEEARKGIRHENCPLKPMPEKKHNNGGYRVIDGMERFYDSEHDDGWNDCLDEILGG